MTISLMENMDLSLPSPQVYSKCNFGSILSKVGVMFLESTVKIKHVVISQIYPLRIIGFLEFFHNLLFQTEPHTFT
jgi:hypothetical protein